MFMHKIWCAAINFICCLYANLLMKLNGLISNSLKCDSNNNNSDSNNDTNNNVGMVVSGGSRSCRNGMVTIL